MASAGTDQNRKVESRVQGRIRFSAAACGSVPADAITGASFQPADLWAEAERRIEAAES